MAKGIIWSRAALADRLSILEYWFQRTGAKSYSRHLDGEFRRLAKLLSRFPEMGRELAGRSERYFVIDHYLMIYQVTQSDVEILHLWDNRRDPSAMPV